VPLHYQLVGIGLGDHLRDGHTTSIFNQSPRSNQPSALCGTGNEYQPKFGDAAGSHNVVLYKSVPFEKSASCHRN